MKLEKTGEFQTSAGQVVELSSSASPRPLALKVLTPKAFKQGERAVQTRVNAQDKPFPLHPPSASYRVITPSEISMLV